MSSQRHVIHSRNVAELFQFPGVAVPGRRPPFGPFARCSGQYPTVEMLDLNARSCELRPQFGGGHLPGLSVLFHVDPFEFK